MRDIRKVLITGMTGFVGSHLADFILEKTQVGKIIGLARWRSPVDNIKHVLDDKRVSLEWGDLEDMSSLLKILFHHKPDIIFHLGAQSYVDFSFQAPISTILPNIVGTCNLLEAVKIVREQEFYKGREFDPAIHICSSSEVYGQVNDDDVPITEDCPFRPASPYAVSKVGEDMLAFQYFTSWNLRTIRTRMFTHTGPRRGDVFVVSTFAKQIAEIEAGLNDMAIMQVGNLDSVRTFMDVRDAVRAYWLLVEKCPAGEVYNIGGNVTMTIAEMLGKLMSMSFVKGIKYGVADNRLRPSDVTLQIPSSEKFKKITGWEPEIPFEKTLLDTLNYWRKFYNVQVPAV